MTYYRKQLFAAETNTIKTSDVEPAISIDHSNRLVAGVDSLRALLGITQMIPMASGNTVYVYKQEKKNTPAQAAEGDTIALAKYERKLARTLTISLKKYRKQTTAEAIQRSGRDYAINETDDLLEREVQKDIKSAFFTELASGTGSADSAASLQPALANLWGALQKHFEDYDVAPVYFVNPSDVAAYLGTAQITIQTAFGLSYVENFLGLGTVIIDSNVTKGTVIATAKENLNGVYAPAGGDVASTFGLTFDETGLVGMKHFTVDTAASVDTLLMSGVTFYAEDLSGVYKASIAAETSGD